MGGKISNSYLYRVGRPTVSERWSVLYEYCASKEGMEGKITPRWTESWQRCSSYVHRRHLTHLTMYRTAYNDAKPLKSPGDAKDDVA